MTKMERLQKENERMKKALEEIYALCNMEGEEQKEFLKRFKFNDDAPFYPIALGSISFMARQGLTAVDKEHT